MEFPFNLFGYLKWVKVRLKTTSSLNQTSSTYDYPVLFFHILSVTKWSLEILWCAVLNTFLLLLLCQPCCVFMLCYMAAHMTAHFMLQHWLVIFHSSYFNSWWNSGVDFILSEGQAEFIVVIILMVILSYLVPECSKHLHVSHKMYPEIVCFDVFL